ncbi:MAG: Two-component system, sensor histidine kinase [Acidimicrobiales bacterium]|nr:Two-component system, sensor histidine kinase [Acidimicrobiales bacterium]
MHQPDEAFRLLVDSVRDYAIFMLDPEGHVVSWNQGAERIKGYSPDEIIGRHFSAFYAPEEVADGICERELEEAVANGRVDAEGWRFRKDGSRFWATVVITALYDDTGTHRGFAKVTRDLTERKQAQDARRHVNELRLRQRHALEVNDDIIQGLAVADLALNLEDYEKARQAISSTLEAARRFVTDLLGDGGDAIPIAPGDLRKGQRQTGS